MPEPRPAGLSHLTFVVADLDAMEAILTGVLGARKVYDSGDVSSPLSETRFFLVGDDEVWVAIIHGEPRPERGYDHVAFKVAAADLGLYRQRVEALGLDIHESRPRVAGEGRSLYFHDRDNHLFELHTGTLSERLARYEEDRPDSVSEPTSPSR